MNGMIMRPKVGVCRRGGPGRPLNSDEMYTLERIAMLDAVLLEDGGNMREYLKQIPNGWRDLRMCSAVLGRLLEKIYDLVPAKTLKHMDILVRYGEMVARVRPVTPPKDHTILETENAITLSNIAMAYKCRMCIRTGREVDKCPLRKAMLEVAPPPTYDTMRCEYWDVVKTWPEGKYED